MSDDRDFDNPTCAVEGCAEPVTHDHDGAFLCARHAFERHGFGLPPEG